MRKSDILLFILSLILVGGVGYWIWQRNVADLPAGGDSEEIGAASKEYRSEDSDLRFVYPSNYAIFEKNVPPARRSIILVEDTEENRRIMEGVSEVPREGPISITVDIRDNPSGATAATWAGGSTDSNLNLANGLFATTTVDRQEGIAYRWSGLYEGETVVVAVNERIYMFTATYMGSSDSTAKDFTAILQSVRF